MSGEARLCYVDDYFAYFTTKDLSRQRGDDWNDVPYEHNAGAPYSPHPGDKERGEHWEIVKVAYEAELTTPAERHGWNSPFSVQMINAGETNWFESESWSDHDVKIPAGVTLEEFIKLVHQANGDVYVLLPKDES